MRFKILHVASNMTVIQILLLYRYYTGISVTGLTNKDIHNVQQMYVTLIFIIQADYTSRVRQCDYTAVIITIQHLVHIVKLQRHAHTQTYTKTHAHTHTLVPGLSIWPGSLSVLS